MDQNDVDTAEALGRIEAKLDRLDRDLFGNGQPGRLTVLESKVSEMDKDFTVVRTIVKWGGAALSLVVSSDFLLRLFMGGKQ